MNEFRNKFRGADLLLVDDIQFISGKEQDTGGASFTPSTTCIMPNKQIVLTSDPPSQGNGTPGRSGCVPASSGVYWAAHLIVVTQRAIMVP